MLSQAYVRCTHSAQFKERELDIGEQLKAISFGIVCVLIFTTMK